MTRQAPQGERLLGIMLPGHLDLVMTTIESHVSVDDVPFGCTLAELQNLLGPPDKSAENYTGELELLYGNSIYRCFSNRFVEVTVPDEGRFRVNGVMILSMFDWIGAQTDLVDRARFKISAAMGIAYDYRDPKHGSLTIFEKGRWDVLLAQTV
jgi:hypothetical protein